MSSFDECLSVAAFATPDRPATDPAALPPQFGFRRWFADRCSRTVELDLSARRGFSRSSRKAGAVRRLLQPDRFASTTVDDPNPAHHDGSRLPTQLHSRVAGAETPLSKRSALGQPRLHGPGVEGTGEKRPIASTPPDAIARAESFAPPRWARAPRVADSRAAGLELPRVAGLSVTSARTSLP